LLQQQRFWAGWLDLSEEEQKHAKDYLANFRTEDTVDELGFGIMRDALADLFFPATSTIMTRTRYLIFVPSLYSIIEDERLSGPRALNRLTQLENELREQLDRPELDGVIGRIAKEELARFPSNIYWNTLKQLGIFSRRAWSQTYYHDHLQQLYDNLKPVSDDDGLPHLPADQLAHWDTKLPRLSSSELLYNPQLNFDLTFDEADYLRTKFAALSMKACTSLADYLIGKRYTSYFDYPWCAPHPDSMSRYIDHAERLSMAAKGATLLYYQMVLEKRGTAGMRTPQWNFETAFSLWWERVYELLRDWDTADFIAAMTSLKAVRPGDRDFFDKWLAAVRSATSATAMFTNLEARQCIFTRERSKRPRKARLMGGDHLRNWNPPDPSTPAFTAAKHIPYWLTYRSGIGRTFITEISKGLGRKRENVRSN